MTLKTTVKTALTLSALLLSSCGSTGFRFDYGYGAVTIEIDGMRFTAMEDYQFQDKEEPIGWGRYLEYKATYFNMGYYWQELPNHHYYFTRVGTKENSPYLNGFVDMTCSAPQVDRGETVTCDYIVLISEDPSFLLSGDVNLFVANNKLERLFYFTTNIENWNITLVEY